jgi:tetratricopeptide (TPR) repeat protein|eukprot:gene8405-8494_t
MKIFTLASITLVLFLSACSVPRYVDVPIEYSPKLTFKPGATTILLVNKFNPDSLKIRNKRKLAAIKSGAFTALKYAEARLGQLPNVKVINLTDSVTLSANTDSIRYLVSKYKTDYVLTLDKFSADIGLEAIDNSTAYYSSNVVVDFTLYESNGIFSKKLGGTVNDPQAETPNYGLFGNLLIHPTVGGSKESINISAEHAAQTALQEYLPSIVSHSRPLFDDDWLHPAVDQILAGAFDKAYNLLSPLLKDPDPKKAAKAYYNLAVVYEAQGDIDLAIKMAQQSLDKNRSNEATVILADLQTE